jgi:VanZ family protein
MPASGRSPSDLPDENDPAGAIRRPRRQSRYGLLCGVESDASGALSNWLPVVVWAAVIFALSAIPSLGTGLGGWDTLLRKAGHMTEYAILGALLLRALGRALPALLAGIAYAVTDEIHQHFVEGRHASPIDVALDAIGVALGIYATNRLLKPRLRDRPPDVAASDISLQTEDSPETGMSPGASSEGQSLGHGS